jgi:hypothetical protein
MQSGRGPDPEQAKASIRRGLLRRAEYPDDSVASRVARSLADGQPEQATALLRSHMNERQNP